CLCRDLYNFIVLFFFFQAEDGIRDRNVTGVQTCALPILSQAINYSLVDKARATDFALQDRSTISLLMPMSEAHATLRQSLIPHLIDDVSYNVARSNHHVALYELGRVFFGNGKDQL